jgi:hypothetical protein
VEYANEDVPMSVFHGGTTATIAVAWRNCRSSGLARGAEPCLGRRAIAFSGSGSRG